MNTHSSADRYRAFWRWHFYAGLFVAPFLIILAVTGAIYLFNDEINDALYPQMRFVQPAATRLPPEKIMASAEALIPGSRTTRIDLPAENVRSAIVFLDTPNGPQRVYVDPGTGRALGSFVYTRTLVGFADVMHGSLLLGRVGDWIVELAACWTVVLLFTGLFLWWPRTAERVAGVVLPRVRAKGRTFWRDLHAMFGLYISALILFLVMTGLPWADVWGNLLNTGANAAGVGYPAAYRMHHAPASTASTVKQAIGEAPWTLEKAPMPHSASHAHHGAAEPIGANAAADIVARLGLTQGYRFSMPVDSHGVYTAYTYPNQPQGQRTIHIDQYTGAVLNDVSYADYGPVAKAVELGVAIHMGNYFGGFNQALMLTACIGAIALPVTGITMWWRRRPAGKLAAPQVSAPARQVTLIVLTLGLAVLFPLAGLSLTFILLIDRVYTIKRIRA